MNDAKSRLIRCFQAVFPSLTPDEIGRASVTSVPSWDSVAALTLLNVVEEEFKLEVAEDDLEMLISFELILSYLEGRSVS